MNMQDPVHIIIGSGLQNPVEKEGEYAVFSMNAEMLFKKISAAAQFYNQLTGEAYIWDLTDSVNDHIKLLEAKLVKNYDPKADVPA
jgi:hypothetical protein